MSPIAPRYRGLNDSSAEPQASLSPILTIPHLLPPEEASAVQPNDEATIQRDSIEVAEEAPVADTPSETTSVEVSVPVAGTMQDSIKRITHSATRSLRQFGKSGTFNPVETVRGVLPGIVISISIICLWWVVGRNSSTPLRQEMAREAAGTADSIKPIADQPLRAPQTAADSAAEVPPVNVAGVDKPDEQLFDHVPFINRPTNDTVSKSGGQTESAPAAAATNGGPQADARPAASPSTNPAERQTKVARNPQGVDRAPRDDRPGQSRLSERPSTEYEWREADRVARREENAVAPRRPRTDPRDARAYPSHARRHEARSRQDEIAAQRQQRREPAPERNDSPVYSYQQTDPATYTDPAYNVPPVARRGRSTQR